MQISTWGGIAGAPCSGPNADEQMAEIRYFIHIIAREFLINKGNASLRLDARKPLCSHSLPCAGRNRAGSIQRTFNQAILSKI